MRIFEIIGEQMGEKIADGVWKQIKRTHDALRKLRVKQAGLAADRVSANALAAGPQREARIRAIDQRDAEARRIYGDEINQANDARKAATATWTGVTKGLE